MLMKEKNANYKAFKMVIFHPIFLICSLAMNGPIETNTLRSVNEEINGKPVIVTTHHPTQKTTCLGPVSLLCLA